MTPIVILCGATASGKTRLALDLASKWNAEIVSADSGQVWRELDIGTAKPTPEEQRAILHHLIDVANPDEYFNAARYVALADKAITDISARGKLPLVVGGTGLYLKILLHGLCEAPPQDQETRAKLERRIGGKGLAALYAELQGVDPETAQKIHANDTTRIVRALEVFELTGYPLSHFHKQHRSQKPRYAARWFGLPCDRAVLNERIDKRVDWMIANGWTEEVRELLKFCSADSQALRSTIGYPQIVAHLRGEISLEEAAARIKIFTRQFAKRQMTWFGADKNIEWIDPNALPTLKQFT